LVSLGLAFVPRSGAGQAVTTPCLRFFKRLNFGADFCGLWAWILAGPCPSIILELPVQKAQGFLVLIALKWLFLEHTRKVFGEIPVRT
jgi:hypothetical protein